MKLGWWSQHSFHQLPAIKRGPSLLWDLSSPGQASHGRRGQDQLSVLSPFQCMCPQACARLVQEAGVRSHGVRSLPFHLVWRSPGAAPSFLRGWACIFFSKMRLRSERQAVDHQDLSAASASLPTIWVPSHKWGFSYINL